MSGNLESEGTSAEEFICRLPSLPDLPDLERSFSLEKHTNRQKNKVAVIPDFNSFVESGSSPLLRQNSSSKLAYKVETNHMESIGKPSESHCFSLNKNRLFIRNPRNFQGHECTPKMKWDTPARREVIAQRPTPIYPRSARREAGAKSRRHSYDETPSRSLSVACTTTPCEVTPFVNSTTTSPSAFKIQNNLFLPIRESDSDFLATNQLIMPSSRLDSTTPPPTLKLRPRGNLRLSIDQCGFS